MNLRLISVPMVHLFQTMVIVIAIMRRISTAFVESTVNYAISKRFVKKQQMRWTQRGAHLLLQTRVQVLNDDLRKIFGRWFQGMSVMENEQEKMAA